MGKFPSRILKKYVFNRLGVRRSDVLVWPGEGIDVAVTSIDKDSVLVSHSDPIVGALKRIGWLAVNIACNDVATSGIAPTWILPTILLPENWSEDIIDEITKDIDIAAKKLNVSVIGGHTGYGGGLLRPIVVVTAMGVGRRDKYIVSSNAREGDIVYLTKGAGLEGTAILASDFRDVLLERGVDEKIINSAEKFIEEISIVKEALKLAETGAINAMHDATRGGVAEALIEIAVSSGTMIEVWEDKIPLRKETKIFADALGFDPLWMISSGTLIFTVSEDDRSIVEDILEDLGILYSQIGVVKRGKGMVVIHRTGRIEEISHTQPEKDELARIWKLYPRV